MKEKVRGERASASKQYSLRFNNHIIRRTFKFIMRFEFLKFSIVLNQQENKTLCTPYASNQHLRSKYPTIVIYVMHDKKHENWFKAYDIHNQNNLGIWIISK